MAGRWQMLAVLTLARAAMGVQFQSVAAVGARLTGEAGLSHTMLGTLIGLYLLPGALLALPGGWLGQRFGDKRLVLIGLGLMTLGGAALGLSQETGPMLAGRAVSGAGAVLLNVLVTKMVADWFAEHEIVPAMGLLITSWPMGIALAMVVLPVLGAGLPVGAGALIAAALAGFALVLVAAIYRAPPQGAAATRPGRVRLTGDETVRAILAGLVWTFYNAGLIAVIAFAPDLLIARGTPPAEATAMVSLVGWLIIPSLALGGWISARVGRPDTTVLGCFALVGASILLLPAGAPALPLLALIGLVFGPPGPLIMTLPVQAVRPEARALGMGIYFTCYYLGMAAVPPLAGWLRDITGTPAAPLWIAVACLGIAALSLVAFRLRGR
ncbi:MFS family permease [Rhodovulum iodosum]|uniref:MFS family permease n=1 Tax=Rhodovulum iodosum TaxID=68291 RepID=A0ABV3XZN0_9RHOB|nr:MFS transporter [Rhodovulum robiginosum]